MLTIRKELPTKIKTISISLSTDMCDRLEQWVRENEIRSRSAGIDYLFDVAFRTLEYEAELKEKHDAH